MAIAFIWDLDGTLIDSYPAIVQSLLTLLRRHGLEMDKRMVWDDVKFRSVHEFIQDISGRLRLEFSALKEEYSAIAKAEPGNIQAMPGAEEVLNALTHLGASQFVYTHKGGSADRVLEVLGLRKYFQEVVTSAAGFRRKPDPQGIQYLTAKYGLEAGETYYVGDRELDVRCAENAGIRSILLDDGSCPRKADLTVHSLIEICGLFSDLEQGPDEESTEYA